MTPGCAQHVYVHTDTRAPGAIFEARFDSEIRARLWMGHTAGAPRALSRQVPWPAEKEPEPGSNPGRTKSTALLSRETNNLSLSGRRNYPRLVKS
jgi:hypothetical protein